MCPIYPASGRRATIGRCVSRAWPAFAARTPAQRVGAGHARDGEGLYPRASARFDRSFPRSSVGTQPRRLRRPLEAKRMKMFTLQPQLSEALSRGRCAATVRTDLAGNGRRRGEVLAMDGVG